jgi:hypothetical protein
LPGCDGESQSWWPVVSAERRDRTCVIAIDDHELVPRQCTGAFGAE